MTNHFVFTLKPLSLALLLVTVLPAAAATPNLDVIARKVGLALPPVLGADNSELVSQLQAPKIENLSFNPDKALSGIFGTTQPVLAGDCKRTTTPRGEPDQSDCVATVGQENGKGAFMRLSFSKTPGVGNISFLSRPPAASTTPDMLKPVQVDNDQAFKLVVNDVLVASLGLPSSEVPLPAAGLNINPFVSDQAIGFAGRVAPVTIRKIVMVPRGLPLTTPIVDKASGHTLSFIPAPGHALGVVEADGSVSVAKIENWMDLRINEKLDPRMAKTRPQLIDEISQELMTEGGGTIGRISAHIVYDVDWRGSFGYLLPAVQIVVSPVTGDLSAAKLAALAKANTPTAGFIKSFALVEPTEASVPGR